MKNQKRKKYGKLIIDLGYVVDPDNHDMIQEAQQCFYEDLMSACKYGDLYNCIRLVESPKSKKSEIPSFLIGQQD
jgi:hypothetical protein